MKTIFTLLLVTIFTTAFAYDGGKLTVTFAAQTNVQVVIDGRAYQQQDNSIVINNIQPGQHSIRIYKAKRAGRNNNRNELLYSANVYVKPAYHVDVMVNRFGKALVDEQPARNNRWEDTDWYGAGHNGGYGQDGYGGNNGYNQPVSESEFSQVLQRIKSQWFGSAKMNTAKEELGRRYFTTFQVRQVLQQFVSESDKLELAKLAYRNTVDSRSYYQLYDVFSFQSSKEELDRFEREFRY